MTQQSVADFIASQKNAWRTLVAVAYQVRPEDVDREAEILSRATGATKAVVRRKFEAVAHKRLQGWSEEAITDAGQGATLSAYSVARNRERTESDVFLRYRVAKSLGETWNGTVARLARVARLRTSDDLIEFLNSCFADLPDSAIRNLAEGMED